VKAREYKKEEKLFLKMRYNSEILKISRRKNQIKNEKESKE
jgi:hypothetical protein